MKGLRQSNKGFTLVELCAVLVLFSILTTIITMSLVSWQEHATYSEQEDNAEMIYLAARNKIAKLRANNALYDFNGWADNDSNNCLQSIPNNYTLLSEEPDEKIYFAVCSSGNYDTYKTNPESVDSKAKLLFDLVSEYIYDKKMLNGNISIEYTKSGNIYAVYYSDRCSFGYNNTGINLAINSNRNSTFLFDNCIGVYISQ